MNKEDSNKLYVLSFIFTSIIVEYHSNIIVEQYYTSNVLRVLEKNLGIFSEYCNVVLLYDDRFLLYNGATKLSINRKIKSRIHTIVIPFLI